jgi:tetratricopeptide (TPR) repeat protein
LEPRSPIPAANLGVFLGTQGRFDEAAEAYAAALDRDPQFAPAHLQRAYCLHVMGDLEASAADYRAFLDIEPDNAAAWDALGAVEAERGEAEAALGAHERALALNPEQPAWYLNAATTARRLGRLDLLTEYAAALERLAPGGWHAALIRAYRQHEADDFGAAWASYVEAFERAEHSGDMEGLGVAGHALLWYALTSKHTEVFDVYMRRLLARGIFADGVLAAIRAWHGRDSSAARSHDVVVEGVHGELGPRPADPSVAVVDGRPVGVIAMGAENGGMYYRREYQVVAENDEEAAAMALAFEGWCGGRDARVVSVTSSSDEGEALRGVYAASPPYAWGKATA